jgi:hypothetical protein
MTDAPPIGHIKIARKAFDDEHGDTFWLEPREFSRWEAWCDVIQLARYSAYRHQTEFGVVDLLRGEFVASIRWLAARWKWSIKRVRGWVSTCVDGARLRAQRETQAGTVYLVVNYDAYQSQGHSRGAVKGTPKGTANEGTPPPETGQSKGHSIGSAEVVAITLLEQCEGTPEGIAKGTPPPEKGHKIEAIQAITALTTLSDSSVETVISHYRDRHPTRRPGDKDRSIVRRALGFGYTPAELCDAIDGNAASDWHATNGQQGLGLVLRNNEKIDDFRARLAAAAPQPAVDPVTGILNARGLAALGIR